MTTTRDPAKHWDDVYRRTPSEQTSWFQRRPDVSLRLLAGTPGSVVDVGAGMSHLADHLLRGGRTDVTLVDVSSEALDAVRERLGPDTPGVAFVTADIVGWEPGRTFDCWHDRAVFHFLTDPAAQATYVETAARLVAPGGVVVLGTFAPDGPTQCSGLPTARHAPDDLAALFSPDFTLEHAEREVHRTPRDAEQVFTWVVLRRG